MSFGTVTSQLPQLGKAVENNPNYLYMKDVRKAGMCSRGARAFFITHNLDWKTFLKSGILIATIEEINDAMGNKVAEVARGRKQ